MCPETQSLRRRQASVFTDFCVQFISGFVFCKRGEKEMAERETERWRDRERETEKEVGF